MNKCDRLQLDSAYSVADLAAKGHDLSQTMVPRPCSAMRPRSTPTEVRIGYERISAHHHRLRHGPLHAYATLVLKGCFIQTGYGGRYRLEAGDVIVQPTLDQHADQMISSGVEIYRLPWRFDPRSGGAYRGCDIDTVLRTARRDLSETARVLEAQIAGLAALGPMADCWSDCLFADLVADRHLRIGDWASTHSMSREHITREFSRIYGISPGALRGELNARAAWRLCIEGPCRWRAWRSTPALPINRI